MKNRILQVFKVAGVTLMIVLSVFLLSACGKQESLEERGYTVVVQYDFNGGRLGESAGRTLYYKENQPLVEPGTVNGLMNPSLDDFHTIAGWKKAILKNGELQKVDVTGENGTTVQQILTEDEFFDFSKERATENCTLVAVWKKLPTVVIHLDETKTEIKPYTPGSTVERNTFIAPRTGYTFYDYYADEELTQLMSFPFTIQDGETVDIYTKWLEGDVLVVRSRSDLLKARPNLDRIILENDIDMENKEFLSLLGSTFNGVLEGNGYTIKNITNTFSRRSNDLSRQYSYGLFGTLGNDAVIENVKFENIQIQISDLNPQWEGAFSVGLLAGTAKKGAAVSGCSFENCVLTLTSTKPGLSIQFGGNMNFMGFLTAEDADNDNPSGGVQWTNNTVVTAEDGTSTVKITVNGTEYLPVSTPAIPPDNSDKDPD